MRATTALAFISLLSIPLTARAGIIDVPGDQPTIAAAVAAASNGDTIRLGKKRHQEAVVTTKSLTFIAKNGAIWDGYFTGSHHAQLKATANSVIVDGIQFENGSDPVTIAGNDAKVRKCRFRGGEDGVYIDGMRAEVSNNVFALLDNGDEVIEIHGPNARVERNRVVDSVCAGIMIDAENGGSALVSKNLMDTCADTMLIQVLNAAAPLIVKNVLRNGYLSDPGIEASNCDDAQIKGNQILRLNYAVEVGIRVSGDRADVSKNILEDLNCYFADMVVIDVTGVSASIMKNRIENCSSGQDHDTYGIQVTGAGAAADKNRLTFLGGGGDETYGILITGNDASASKNFFDRFNDEYTHGIEVTGDRAEIVKNTLNRFLYGDTIYVQGNDFKIVSNTIRNGAYDVDPINAFGSATLTGSASIEKNKIFNCAGAGVDLNGNGVTIRKNSVNHVVGIGFDISGNDNVLEGNEANDTQGDAFSIGGNNNSLSKCVASNSGKDGFDMRSGAGNSLFKCKATNCVAEGLDNGATATVATKCALKGNRIDYAGAGKMASDAGTVFDTGGAGTLQEID